MTQTLGAYSKELRTSARRYPLLTRTGVEALGDKLGGELARRFGVCPPVRGNVVCVAVKPS